MLAGRSERHCWGGGGGVWIWAYRIASELTPVNGARPVIASYAMIPSAYRSVPGPVSPTVIVSGAMYSAVPTRVPVWVKRLASAARAIPKSTRVR